MNKNAKRAADLHEAVARFLYEPKVSNRKERRKLERKIARLRRKF